MWKCKVCLEKDARIKDLQSQIADLKSLLFTPSSQHIPVVHLEADAIINNTGETMHLHERELTADEIKRLEEEQSEAARLLSGSY
jgi:hypothetical protein